MEAGWITIGTDLKTDKFEKKLSKIKKQIDEEEKKKITYSAQISDNTKQLQQYEAEIENLKELKAQLKDVENARLEELKANPTQNFNATLENGEGTAKYQGLLQQQASLNSEIQSTQKYLDGASAKIEKMGNETEILKAKFAESNEKIKELQKQAQQVKFTQVKEGLNSLQSGIQSSIKSIGRMIVGIFGIRSAIAGLRSMSSVLAQYNEGYANQIEYIKWALAQSLAPVLQWIVSLASRLLYYLRLILGAWFGIGKNADLSAKAFQNAKESTEGVSKSTKSSAKNTKEMQKSLAGFDEMNVLQNNSQKDTGGSSAGGGSAGGGGDLGFKPPEDYPIPKWLQWLLDNGNIVKEIIKGIGFAIAGIKIADFLKDLGLLGEGIGGFKKLILGLGIGLILKGVYDTVKAIIEFVKDPSWENFAKILEGLATILLGISIVLMVIKGFSLATRIMLIIALVTLLVAEIIKHWGEIKEILSKVGQWIYDNVITPVVNFFKWLWEEIKTGVTNAWNAVKGAIQGVAQWIYDHIIKPVADFFVNLWHKITTGVTNAWNTVVRTIQGVANWIYVRIITPVANFFVSLWNRITTGVANVWNGVVSVIQGVAGWVNSYIIQPIIGFFSNLWSNIQNGLSAIGSFFSNIFNGMRNIASSVINSIIGFFHSLGNTVSRIINGIWSVVRNVINFIIRGINTLIRGINRVHFTTPDWVPLVGGKSFGFNVPQIRYLKTGAIVSMPNKGVALGSNVRAGEAGREGILPLDNAQTMAMLGREIGKHIVINATIENNMNGRIIARQLQQIQADNDFAFNS